MDNRAQGRNGTLQSSVERKEYGGLRVDVNLSAAAVELTGEK